VGIAWGGLFVAVLKNKPHLFVVTIATHATTATSDNHKETYDTTRTPEPHPRTLRGVA
jgi:hypothetical protein